MVKALQVMQFEKIEQSFETKNRQIAAASTNKRAAEISSHKKATKLKLVNFEVGDFVPVGYPLGIQRARNRQLPNSLVEVLLLCCDWLFRLCALLPPLTMLQ